jgi:hypothetical protein
MIINNPDFLSKVILSMAEEAYQNEIINSNMEELTIGNECTWVSKEEWISDFIIEHFNIVKGSLSYQKYNNDIEKNTFLVRLYSLDIGESFDIDNFTQITRFPGGWSLKFHSNIVFIPYDNEFRAEHGILAKEFEKLNKEEKVDA